MREGLSLEEATAEAQRGGFAEADANEDLSGRDAWRKLQILCRHAFGAELGQMDVRALDHAMALSARELAAAGKRVRQIARAGRRNGQLWGVVRFEAVELDSPFARLEREWNALRIVSSGARQIIVGRGAGCWPSTEAVMADLFDAHRQRTAVIHPKADLT